MVDPLTGIIFEEDTTPDSFYPSNSNLVSPVVIHAAVLGTVTLELPDTVTPYILALPAAQGLANQVLANDGAGNLVWTTLSSASGTVTQVNAGTGLLGGPITTIGTLSVDVGTGPNQIVQLDGASKLRALDGSALTNLNATNLATGTVAAARIANPAGDVSGTYAALVVSKIQGTAVSSTAPTNGKALIYNSGTLQWEPTSLTVAVSSLTAVGSSPNANAGTISGANLTLQPADGTNPGVITSGTQTIGGDKTFNGSAFILTKLGVGLSTLAANTPIQIQTSGLSSDQSVKHDIYATNNQAGFNGRRARGTSGSPLAVQSGDILGFFGADGYGATGFHANTTAIIQMAAAEAFSDSVGGTHIDFRNAPTGSITKATNMRLHASGRLLVGTTTDDTTNRLQVNGSIASSALTATGTVTAGALTTTGTITGNHVIGKSFDLSGATSGTIFNIVPAIVSSYTLTWPAANGSANSFLQNDGLGVLSWSTVLHADSLILSGDLSEYNPSITTDNVGQPGAFFGNISDNDQTHRFVVFGSTDTSIASNSTSKVYIQGGNLLGAAALTPGVAGPVILQGGGSFEADNIVLGARVDIEGGFGGMGGGPITIDGGSVTGVGTGDGGSISINGGAGGSVSGSGGDIQISGGSNPAADGIGRPGTITLTTQDNANGDGSNIILHAGTGSGNNGDIEIHANAVRFTNQTPILNVNDPTNAQDAATKNYVDNNTSNEASTGTVTWTGTTAPTGVSSLYRYTRIGKSVTLSVSINVSVAGLAITKASFDLPVDVPTPHRWSNNSDSPYLGAGLINDSLGGGSGFDPNLALSGKSYLYYTGSVWSVVIGNITAVSATQAWCVITFQTD